jgi:membrane glycosyltransferase
MPVYNEDPHDVFAGVRAIYESLQATGQGQAFDFFVLSDTTNPDLWLAEELAWARLTRMLTGPTGIFYRHRPRNQGRKAGNIADFCERWGSAYRYMIVLDADSVMSGETLVEMVRRMEQDPEIGILQVPPIPVNRASLFARCQQFAARVYGPVFLEGFAWWSDIDGNYWGHNAIIRVAPFTHHCGLSALPGAPPLGGEILSHDFVEAALMRRAGLKVCLAHDLDGSYEESPPTLVDFAQRDHRWCQGNLQHIRLVFSYGMEPMSRLHLGMGALSYLSSPLWLLFLVLGCWSAALRPGAVGVRPAEGAVPPEWWGGGLFAVTMTLLLLPKLWGYLLLVRDPQRLAVCGGAFKALVSVLIETVVSILVAPIMMAFHVVFVLSTFLGYRVVWNAQQRREGGQQVRAALSAHWKQTLAGLGATCVVWLLVPGNLPWLSPVLCGLILAVPLSLMLSSVPLGQALARQGLLITPEETAAPPVLQRHRSLLAEPAANDLLDTGGLLHRVLTDPAFAALHGCVLQATAAHRHADPQQVRRVEKQLRAGTLQRVSSEDRKAVLSDTEALQALRVSAWTDG